MRRRKLPSARRAAWPARRASLLRRCGRGRVGQQEACARARRGLPHKARLGCGGGGHLGGRQPRRRDAVHIGQQRGVPRGELRGVYKRRAAAQLHELRLRAR
eukprot:59639-Chlamydomonas_euryale.AAC.1